MNAGVRDDDWSLEGGFHTGERDDDFGPTCS